MTEAPSECSGPLRCHRLSQPGACCRSRDRVSGVFGHDRVHLRFAEPHVPAQPDVLHLAALRLPPYPVLPYAQHLGDLAAAVQARSRFHRLTSYPARAQVTARGLVPHVTTTVGPIATVIDFYLPRPASAPKSRARPDRRPDLDKLVRATLDGLTDSGVIEDDASIVEIAARKHYAASRACAVIGLNSA